RARRRSFPVHERGRSGAGPRCGAGPTGVRGRVERGHGAARQTDAVMRGHVTVHRDRAAVDAFLPTLAARLAPDSTDRFLDLLRSPNRVVLEFVPTEIVASHDSRLMAGDGRGGSGGGSNADSGGGSDTGGGSTT